MVEKSILKFSDPELNNYIIKLKELEFDYNKYINQKIELEKILIEFQHQHTIELGSLILNILKLRKEKFHNDKELYEEAEKDEKQYQGQFNEEKDIEITILDNDQKTKLKKHFRKASVLCHPDKVCENNKKEAQEIFIKLKQAYDKNDLKKVKEILKELQKGSFKSNSDTTSEIENIKKLINQLKQKTKNIINEIISLESSETYLEIIKIKDWNKYFKKKKKQLKKEYKDLKKSE